jgi:small subunit ribosomal protein YMR-31
MIRFLGKRSTPQSTFNRRILLDRTSNMAFQRLSELPSSFKSYRQKAQQHGPLNHIPSAFVGGHIGGASGRDLGPIEAGKGLYFDRSELPARFQNLSWTQAEMELLESGGASAFA